MEENQIELHQSMWDAVYLPFLKEKFEDTREFLWILFIVIETSLIFVGYVLGIFAMLIAFWIGLFYLSYKLVYIPIKEKWLPYLTIYRVLYLIAYPMLVNDFASSELDPTTGEIMIRAFITGIGLLIPYFILLFIPKHFEASKTEQIRKTYNINSIRALVIDLNQLNKYERQDLEANAGHKYVFTSGINEKKNLFNQLLEEDRISKIHEITMWRSNGGFKPKYYLVLPIKHLDGQTVPIIRSNCPGIEFENAIKLEINEKTMRRDLEKIGLFWDPSRLPPSEFAERINQIRSNQISNLI